MLSALGFRYGARRMPSALALIQCFDHPLNDLTQQGLVSRLHLFAEPRSIPRSLPDHGFPSVPVGAGILCNPPKMPASRRPATSSALCDARVAWNLAKLTGACNPHILKRSMPLQAEQGGQASAFGAAGRRSGSIYVVTLRTEERSCIHHESRQIA